MLSLLAAPINAAVLQALADGPKSQMDLCRAAGSPSQSTLRLRLRELTQLGVLRRSRQDGFPRALDYELAEPGRELLVVVAAMQLWLANCPAETITFGTHPAKGAIKALAEGWSSNLIRALAARSLTLTELDRLISGLNYPSLERRLGTMRRTEQIEPLPSPTPGTPYTVTAWLRHSIVPLIVAARWERLYAPEETTPIGRLDIEAAFLLAVPLLQLADDLSGSCRLGVETTSNGGARRLAGVMVEVVDGQVVSCLTSLDSTPTAWASGSAAAWLTTVIEHDREGLEIGGERQLACALVDGLNGALFDAACRAGAHAPFS